MKDNHHTTLINVAWTAIGQFSVQGLTFLTAAILARFLSPEDFGLVSMVLIINAFLAIFANAGLKATTVQNQDFGIREHRAVYGLTWIVGAAVGVLFISLSPAAVFFFGEQRLYGICFTLAPAIFLTSLTQVPMGVLEKRMAFRQLALSHIISVFSASLISVLLAYFSFGYWALVYQIVLRNLFLLLLLLSITRIGWFPRFSREIYKRIFGYTGNLTGFKFLNYFSRNLDNILIGRFLGVFSLGLYSRAYSIMSVFRHAVGAVIGPVMHASMARRQNDIDYLRSRYGQIIEGVLWMTAPIMGLCAAFPKHVINFVWGIEFTEAAGPFFWLALCGMHQGVLATTGTIYALRSKTKELLIVGLVTTLVYGLSILIGIRWGITGVAASYSLASHVIFLPLMSYLWIGLLHGTFRHLIKLMVAPIVVGFMAVITSLIGRNLTSENEVTAGLFCFVFLAWGITGFFLGHRKWNEIFTGLGLRSIFPRSS